jgi:hypothetical protein
MRKVLLLIIFFVNLIACATTKPIDQSKNSFTPENFIGNPRIVFRDITIPSHKVVRRSQKKFVAKSIKENYGTSINDNFNNISHSTVQNDIVLAQSSAPLAVREVPKSTPQPASQVSASQETTYVPLTFPIPPPKDMMQKFHMQVGQME